MENPHIGILLMCRKHMYDRIISLRGDQLNPATFHGSVCIKLGNGWMDGRVSVPHCQHSSEIQS
jgi:hypothetical protein